MFFFPLGSSIGTKSVKGSNLFYVLEYFWQKARNYLNAVKMQLLISPNTSDCLLGITAWPLSETPVKKRNNVKVKHLGNVQNDPSKDKAVHVRSLYLETARADVTTDDGSGSRESEGGREGGGFRCERA